MAWKTAHSLQSFGTERAGRKQNLSTIQLAAGAEIESGLIADVIRMLRCVGNVSALMF